MLLLIPGPVTTHPDVRAALAQDLAPWDNDFRAVCARVLDKLLHIAGGSADEHAVLPLQGCGHFATEAAIRTFVRRDGRLLVPMTGSYARRMVRLAQEAGRAVVELPVPLNEKVDLQAVAAALAADPAITHLACVYSETSTGIVQDAMALGVVARQAGRRLLIDAVSAFGALPFDIAAMPELDAAVFTANKCLEGVPGISFAVAPAERLKAASGQAESWSLDLADIHQHALRQGRGSFRFTPPAQAIAALDVALDLYAKEGRAARLARYTANMGAFYDGVRAIGLVPYLPADVQGPIIVNVRAPTDPAWNLQAFVDALKRRSVLISNFFDTPEPSFRVGCIGQVTPHDMQRAVDAMVEALDEIGVRSRRAA